MDTDATRAVPAEVIRYFLKRVTASPPGKRLEQRESILFGPSRFSNTRADRTARQRTAWPPRVGGTREEKESTAARKLETVTADEAFDYTDREPGVS